MIGVAFASEVFSRELMVNLVNDCLQLMLKCSTPMLAAAIITGIVVAMFQSVTQVQEQTLSFVPKIVGTFVAVAMYGPEICDDCLHFAVRVLSQLASLGPNRHF